MVLEWRPRFLATLQPLYCSLQDPVRDIILSLSIDQVHTRLDTVGWNSPLLTLLAKRHPTHASASTLASQYPIDDKWLSQCISWFDDLMRVQQPHPNAASFVPPLPLATTWTRSRCPICSTWAVCESGSDASICAQCALSRVWPPPAFPLDPAWWPLSALAIQVAYMLEERLMVVAAQLASSNDQDTDDGDGPRLPPNVDLQQVHHACATASSPLGWASSTDNISVFAQLKDRAIHDFARLEPTLGTSPLASRSLHDIITIADDALLLQPLYTTLMFVKAVALDCLGQASAAHFHFDLLAACSRIHHDADAQFLQEAETQQSAISARLDAMYAGGWDGIALVDRSNIATDSPMAKWWRAGFHAVQAGLIASHDAWMDLVGDAHVDAQGFFVDGAHATVHLPTTTSADDLDHLATLIHQHHLAVHTPTTPSSHTLLVFDCQLRADDYAANHTATPTNTPSQASIPSVLAWTGLSSPWQLVLVLLLMLLSLWIDANKAAVAQWLFPSTHVAAPPATNTIVAPGGVHIVREG